MNALVVPGVPLQGDVERLGVVVFGLVPAHLGEQRLFRRVQVVHKVDDSALVLEDDRLFLALALIGKGDFETPVEERHRLQSLEHGAGVELGALSGEDDRIGPEADRGARHAAVGRGWPGVGDVALRRTALGVLLVVTPTVLVDLDDQSLGQRVDDRDAHAVQSTRDLVALAAELATGVQHSEYDLGRALALVRTRRIRVDRDATAVVVDPASAVGEDRDADTRAEARHCLVDGVVNHFPDEVVQPRQTGGTDVHTRALAHRVEALEDLNVFRAVVGVSLVLIACLGTDLGVGVVVSLHGREPLDGRGSAGDQTGGVPVADAALPGRSR